MQNAVKNLNPAMIKWVDSQTISSQMDLEEAKELETVETVDVGFLIHEDKENVILCQEAWAHGDVRYCHIIPQKIILEIVRLRT